MKSPFENSRAFAAFFTDRVAIEASRPAGGRTRGTYAACVFPGAQADPFAEVSSESNAATVTILIAKGGPFAWNLTTPPQPGDIVTHNGKRYAVVKRDDYVREHFHLEAREA